MQNRTRYALVVLTACAAWYTMTVATADTVTYTYDALGRLSVVSYPAALAVTYTYDAAGNRTQVQTSDGSPPGAPGVPTFSSITAKTATVSWTTASGTVTGYSYSLNSGSTWTSVGTALTVALTGLTQATTYTVQVRATNSGANGPSSSASFTTWHQITDSNGNLLSGVPYTTMLVPGTGPPYTDWLLKQNYGSYQLIWDISGLCPNGGNSLTTTGYVRIAGGCEIDASPSVYGH